MDVSVHLCRLSLLSFPYLSIKLTIEAENRGMKGNSEAFQKASLVLQESHSLSAKSTWVSLGANKNTTEDLETPQDKEQGDSALSHSIHAWFKALLCCTGIPWNNPTPWNNARSRTEEQ